MRLGRRQHQRASDVAHCRHGETPLEIAGVERRERIRQTRWGMWLAWWTWSHSGRLLLWRAAYYMIILMYAAMALRTVGINLEPGAIHGFGQLVGHAILTLRDEIERRTEAVLLFDLHQLLNAREAFGAFDIVRRNKRELFAFGPPWPARGRHSGFRVDRPYMRMANAPAMGQTPTESHTDTPGNQWLEEIIRFG